jgi:hypothetical protein
MKSPYPDRHPADALMRDFGCKGTHKPKLSLDEHIRQVRYASTGVWNWKNQKKALTPEGFSVLYDHCLEEGQEVAALCVIGAFLRTVDSKATGLITTWVAFHNWMNWALNAVTSRAQLEAPRRIALLGNTILPFEVGEETRVGRVLHSRLQNDGTYRVEMQITDDETWQRIQNGDLTGWSMGARAAPLTEDSE